MVHGEDQIWLCIYLQKNIDGKPIDVYNYGNMKRDFTYIDDIISGIISSIIIITNMKYLIWVIILRENLMDIVSIIENKLVKKL